MCGMDIWYDPDPPSADFMCCICHDVLTSSSVVLLDDDTGTYCQECAEEQREDLKDIAEHNDPNLAGGC